MTGLAYPVAVPQLPAADDRPGVIPARAPDGDPTSRSSAAAMSGRRLGVGPPASATPARATPAIWARAIPRRTAIAVEIGLIVLLLAFKALRVPTWLLAVWGILAGMLAIVAPASGLVLLAATGPFSEGDPTRELTTKAPLSAGVVAGVAIRAVAGDGVRALLRRVTFGPIPLFVALAAGTALSVIHALVVVGPAHLEGIRLWAGGPGIGLVALAAAVWCARAGELRPLAVAVGSTWLSGIVALAAYVNASAVASTPIGWMLRIGTDEGRLSGVIQGPNAIAAMLLIPASILGAAALLGPDRRLRLFAAAGCVPMIVAILLTFSRSALLAMLIVVPVLVFRIHRRLGMALVIAGVAAALVVVPRYISARDQVVHPASGVVDPLVLITQGDKPRFQAWGAAVRMFAASPLTGAGYGIFFFQHARYGEPLINAPHNEILRLFGEDGALVGVLGIAFGAASLAVLVRGRGWLAAGLFASFVSWCVMINFNNPFSYMQVTIPVFIALGSGLGLAAVRSRERAAITGHGRLGLDATTGRPDAGDGPPAALVPA